MYLLHYLLTAKSSSLLLILVVGLSIRAQAQCTAVETSSDGYTISVFTEAQSILPSSLSCPFGYNYNISVDYTISFSGTNIPGSMYTLQGTIHCGGESHFFNLPNSAGSGTVNSGSNPYRTAADCATATPSSLGCDSAVIQVQGPGLSTTFSSCGGAVLPIELIHFKAILTEFGEVAIQWTTASETNNDYFSIERSINGKNWETISTVPGTGNSNWNINYEFVDPSPLKGVSYYRLKQTDFDGKYSYSATSYVMNRSQTSFRIYPNPTSDKLTVEVDGTHSSINLLSSLGQPQKVSIEERDGFSVIDVSTLPSGVYFLQLGSNSNTKVEKVVIR